MVQVSTTLLSLQLIQLLLFSGQGMIVLAQAGVHYSICMPEPDTSTHQHSVRNLDDTETKTVGELTQGKITLVVNVASFCRLTLHYYEMNELLDKFPESKFSILAFPSDQFGHQEPGVNGTEIMNCLKNVRPGEGFKPHPRLHLMKRGDVNGRNEISLYTYLKNSCAQPTSSFFMPRENFWEPIKISDVTWNFEKFLVSADGQPLFRFRPDVSPLEIADVISSQFNQLDDETQQMTRLLATLSRLDLRTCKRLCLDTA